MQSSKPILLIEDDYTDKLLVKRALDELKITNELVHTVNGEEALEYLRNEANESPCIILVDLNMPRMDGFEFMRVIKADETLRIVPVVVLTTSKEKGDVAKSFKLGAAGYMVKPPDFNEFVETIRCLDLYWSSSKLPNENRDY